MSHRNLLETYLSAQRQAVDALMDLYQSLEFNDPVLALKVQIAGELCQHREASILGNAMAAAEQVKTGNFESLDAMERNIALGMGAHKNGVGSRWQVGGLMHLQPVLDAIELAARSFAMRYQPRTGASVKRLALVVSNLSEGAATTMVARKFASSLQYRGLETYVLLTGHASSPRESASSQEENGIHLIYAGGQTVYERTQDLVRCLRELELDAIVYYAWPTDITAQIATCVRMSPRQMFINHTCDQKVGDFDVRICYTREMAGLTDSSRCQYVPPVRVREEKYHEIAEADLSQWGIDEDVKVIGNYSRLSKCVDELFLMAMVKILENNPSVVLMLPGLPDPASEKYLRARFDLHGLQQQVRFPGYLSDAYLPLLKATRIYCDTFAWTGGQSVLDAMAMGVPVVASLPEKGRSALDPSGVSPVSLASSLVPDTALVSQSGDVDGYVAIVQRLLDNTVLHQSQSLSNMVRSEELAWPQYPRLIIELLNQVSVVS